VATTPRIPRAVFIHKIFWQVVELLRKYINTFLKNKKRDGNILSVTEIFKTLRKFILS